MRYIEFNVNTGERNMQIDSDLLDFAIKNQLSEPVFRLYAWSPACVSLGRNQSDDFLDMEFLKSKNIDVVRRLTGGRALLHDKELTYSYICPISSLENGESIVNSYKEISQLLINGFERLGINLEFPQNKKPHTKNDYCMSISTGADLSFDCKKFIGSAQFRKEGYILQHGSILFNYDKDLIEKLFNEKVDENSLTCLDFINPEVSFDEVISALHDAFVNHCRQTV
jgi:lipoate-protein ligase A